MTAGRAKLEQALTECTLHAQVLGEAGAALPPAFSAAMVAVVATLPLSTPIAFVTAKPCFSHKLGRTPKLEARHGTNSRSDPC